MTLPASTRRKTSPSTSEGSTRALAEYSATVRFEDLPPQVVERTKDFFVDWIASALAGAGARPVAALDRFAAHMGPATGPCELLASRKRTSALFAALVNGASSHVVEQDDVHNGSVFHPGTVVFPAVLGAAQDCDVSGEALLAASVVGYEVGVRVGEFLGQSHYKVFHTTGTAGTLAAAAGVAHVLRLDAPTTLHALGSAGTQAAGLWEFLRDAADSKQLHTAKAASDGLLAAYTARDGLTGAERILEGQQGMAAGMSRDANPAKLTDDLGKRWAILETSFKVHASCRHTHPAADALQQALQAHRLSAGDITRVRAHVYQAAIDVLAPAEPARTVHQAKFSMGFVLALIAVRGHASLTDFTQSALADPDLRDFQRKVEMVHDDAVESAYPARWVGLVEVETLNGHHYTAQVEAPKGDPDNTLTRPEIDAKAMRLATFGATTTADEMRTLLARAWALESQATVRDLLSPSTAP